MSARKKILILTGAGISAESGIKTFRDSGGLWNDHEVWKVASPKGWQDNPELVLNFYNERRNEVKGCVPNKAHILCSELQNEFDVNIFTQNVDNLHERAGSRNVTHLHGSLFESRCSVNRDLVYDCQNDINIGNLSKNGYQLRPNIVFFGESLNSEHLYYSEKIASESDICIIVGTSMKVYPAAALPFKTKETCIIYYVDPSDIEFEIPKFRKGFFYHIKDVATKGMEYVKKDIEEIFLNK